MTTKSVVNCVRQLFSLDVFGVVIDRCGTWAIDWINRQEEKILGHIELYRNRKYHLNGDATLDYVLRHARVSRYCIIDDCVSDDFEFNGKLGPMRKLFIGSIGHWVTLNNLINFDVLFIRIQGSILSVSDLNSFLRHWRTGGSARLEWLYLNFEKGMFRETFDEDLEIVKTDEVMTVVVMHWNGYLMVATVSSVRTV